MDRGQLKAPRELTSEVDLVAGGNLVATNFFGQNTPAIMATEAAYVEMWAQDAAAILKQVEPRAK